MIKVIAIFLILKAVSNGIKMFQMEIKKAFSLLRDYSWSKYEFMGHVTIEFILLVVHLWFGVWMLLNLC